MNVAASIETVFADISKYFVSQVLENIGKLSQDFYIQG